MTQSIIINTTTYNDHQKHTHTHPIIIPTHFDQADTRNQKHTQILHQNCLLVDLTKLIQTCLISLSSQNNLLFDLVPTNITL